MSGHYAPDLTGKRFGKLVVVGRAPNYARKRADGTVANASQWYCQCDCGSPVKVIRGTHLIEGKIESCGCVRLMRSIEAHIKHNQSKTRLYRVWCNIKNRCYNPNVRSYKTYGARGKPCVMNGSMTSQHSAIGHTQMVTTQAQSTANARLIGLTTMGHTRRGIADLLT